MSDGTAAGSQTTDGNADQKSPEGQDSKTPETPKAPEQKAPEFDGPFDEDRAKRLIENLRNDLKAKGEKLTAFETAEKERQQAEMSDLQKAVARAEAAEKALAEREAADLKQKIADDFEVPAELLTATTEDDLKAQAAKAAEILGARTPKTPAPGAKPKPKLSPGSGGEAPEAIDHVAMAARMKRR